MIPHLLHFIWFGDLLPPSSIRTFYPRHTEWQFMLWNEGAVKHAFGIDPRAMREELGSWAAVSNLVRLRVLQISGGIYVDCDFECHKPLDSLLENAAVVAEQDAGRLCNAFMGAEPGHPWINWQCDHWGDFDQRDPASGVYLATEAPREGLAVIPSHFVYPFLYNAPVVERVPHPDSILSHGWEGSWR